MKTFEQFIESEDPEVIYYPSGSIKSKTWKKRGLKHREDGPAYIEWFKNGQKRRECWYLNGKKQRKDGEPSEIWYSNRNGEIISEEWYKKSLKHREDGPAEIRYIDGIIKAEYYYLNDLKYIIFNDWLERLKKINPEQYKIWKKKKEFKDLGI